MGTSITISNTVLVLVLL